MTTKTDQLTAMLTCEILNTLHRYGRAARELGCELGRALRPGKRSELPALLEALGGMVETEAALIAKLVEAESTGQELIKPKRGRPPTQADAALLYGLVKDLHAVWRGREIIPSPAYLGQIDSRVAVADDLMATLRGEKIN
jgi:hypothetical protein